MDIIYCAFDPATYLIISEEVAPLIYYSHFVAMFAALAISLLVFTHNRKALTSHLFLAFAMVFGTWAFLDVILWATNDPGIVMFAWSIQVLAEPVLYAIAFYLFYTFIFGRTPSLKTNAFVGAIMLPLIILLPTNLNVDTVYLSYCETDEGPLALYYTYFLNISFIALTIYAGIRGIPKLSSDQKKAASFFIVGLIIFLLSFTAANALSSFTDNWDISQYGLFGMPIFAALIAYSIVQFRAFKIQIAGAQILVVVLMALVASLLVVGPTYRILITSTTLFMTTVAGIFLIRSVRKEFQQKLELEQLAASLERANKRLKVLDKMKSEFVSIASHQLRSPLTSIRGYASMLLEGSFGNLSTKAKEAVERIADSSKFMATSVEDYLNVSRIQAGNMKYELSDFNLRDEAEVVVDNIRQQAIKKGLLLTFKSDLEFKGVVNADIGKSRQILQNIINNALKYTPHGSINVVVRDQKRPKRIMIDVIDTGIGMKKETIESMFDKFERADNANSVNVSGTGLGLYIARKMARDMEGDVYASSEGEGKGSTFTFELPLKL